MCDNPSKLPPIRRRLTRCEEPIVNADIFIAAGICRQRSWSLCQERRGVFN